MPVRDVSNLTVTMSPSASSVPIGQTLGYTITVSNPGPADEPDAVLTVPLPASVTLVSDSSTQTAAPSVTQGMISADLGALAVGDTATLTLAVTPQASAFGLLTMSAVVQGYNADTEPALSEASATVNVASTAGLSIAITPQATPVHQDQDLTYLLTVSNAGPSEDTNVVATAPLPPGATFVSATSSQPVQPSLQAGGIYALLGTLAAGQSATVAIVVLPSQPAPAPAGLVLNAGVAGDDFNPDPAATTAMASMPILPSDDLCVTFGPAASARGGGQEPDVDRDSEQPWTLRRHRRERSVASDLRLERRLGVRRSGCRRRSRSNLDCCRPSWAHSRRAPARRSPSSCSRWSAGPATWTARVTGDEFDLSPVNNQASVTVGVAESPGILQFASPG